MKKWMAIALIILFTANVNTTKAGDIATETTQTASSVILGGIQWASWAIRTATEAVETWEAKAAELINTATAGFNLLTQDTVMALATELGPILEAGEALAHTAADLEAVMNAKFKTYDDYLAVIEAEILAAGELDVPRFEERFKEWSTTHRDTIKATLESHGLHADRIMDKHTRMNELQNLSKTSRGRMQALQAGHQIAIEEVKQLNELQQILMEQSNLHASYFAMKQAMESEERAASKIRREKLAPTSTIDGQAWIQ